MLAQYIVLRRDLGWPLGALCAQAAHASIAAIHAFPGPDTSAYLEDLSNMRKLVLGATEVELKALILQLEKEGLEHHVWIEQPENIVTAVALRPYPKSRVAKILRHLPLLQ
ncbi:Aminoacyl-tRNA hydrolase [Giardia muris]|uniref:peptidyl-tRNA hydrolase n=1 Tax=Giardia muris TaxID=5742 RepID=A0A4Z1SP27_GIAMU|nr:Aminoacyl-tRNA hydrolase [Giardia muris]|eukprot:TNJ27556.1 Aminoacyl-tRNA hydrolase [Giardia muris]